MVSTISKDEASTIRKNLEKAGRPVPQALKDATDPPPAAPPAAAKVPADQPKPPAAGRHPLAQPPKPKTVAAPKAAPASKPAPAAAPPTAGTGPKSGSKGKGKSYGRGAAPLSGTTKTARSRAKSFLGSPSTLGGSDGGGLILTFWLYPLVLAIVQEGAIGPGIWLRAKFLNIGTAPPAGSKYSGPAYVGATRNTTAPPTATTGNATPPAATPPGAPGKAV